MLKNKIPNYLEIKNITANVAASDKRKEIPSKEKYLTFDLLPYSGPCLKPI